MAIVEKSPLTNRSVSDGAPSTILIRGGKSEETKAVVCHVPPSVIPNSYNQRVKAFLSWLGLNPKLRYIFHKKDKIQRHLSVMVQYFCLFSVKISNKTKGAMREYVRLVDKLYCEVRFSMLHNRRDFDGLEYMISGKKIPTNKLFVPPWIWRRIELTWGWFQRGLCRFSCGRCDTVEIVSAIRYSRF